MARRQQAFAYRAKTCVEFEPRSFLQCAGLIAWYDTGNYYYLRITRDEKLGKVLDIIGASQYFAKLLLRNPIPVNGAQRVHLRSTVTDSRLVFDYSMDAENWNTIGKRCYDASILSDEHHEILRSPIDKMIMRVMGNYSLAFTGAFVGMCCQDLSGHRLPADFDDFEYSEHE